MGEKAQPVVSVIIPVYNVEKYLRQSLDCILGQTLTDIEVICVDDGSTDQSSAILEEYAQKDTRMKVLRQENRGAGAARNLGFSHAVGTYAYFFDADDLCSLELLEKTVNRAEETGGGQIFAILGVCAWLARRQRGPKKGI
ncbi:MAG: glycosyltransferase, partial [Clostridiales bacterium]|nr:glycosyltransferase [Clostridiales bacterium]